MVKENNPEDTTKNTLPVSDSPNDTTKDVTHEDDDYIIIPEQSQSEAQKIPPLHVFSQEESKKGGQSKSDAKLFAMKFNPREWCNNKCPMYPCPFQPLSHSKNHNYAGHCALKTASPKMQDMITKLYLHGREGAINEFISVTADLAILADNDNSLRGKALYHKRLGEFVEKAYGRVINAEVKGDISGEIKIRWMNDKDEDTALKETAKKDEKDDRGNSH